MYLSTQYRVDSSLVRTEHAHELGIYDADLCSLSFSLSSSLSPSLAHTLGGVRPQIWTCLSLVDAFFLSLFLSLSSSLPLSLSFSLYLVFPLFYTLSLGAVTARRIGHAHELGVFDAPRERV